jgi:HlyD family secretion protein
MSKKTKFRIGFFILVIAFVAIVAFFAFGSIFHSEAAIPDDRLEEIVRGDLSLSVVATGSIVPVATVEIKSKSSGLVKEILVDDGDLVQPGQILVELDKELLQAQVRESEANLQATVARQQEAESVHTSAISMKKKIGMDLDNLDDKVEYHQKQVHRYQLLFEEKLIPHSELEAREREFHDAGFAREALRSELLIQDSRIDAAQKAISRVSAEVSQAEATLDRAKENLRHATIRSPLKATVLKRHVEVGDAVSSILQLGSQATLMFTLGDMNEVFFEGRVDETDIGKVFDNQPARVKVDAFREQPFDGKVIRIAPLGVEEDNVIGFEVRVSLDDPEGILRAQMSANAEIIVEEKQQILLIPESAIIYDKDKKTFAEVYAPEIESQKERIPIEIGISNGSVTEVMSGLQEGQRVIRLDTGGII